MGARFVLLYVSHHLDSFAIAKKNNTVDARIEAIQASEAVPQTRERLNPTVFLNSSFSEVSVILSADLCVNHISLLLHSPPLHVQHYYNYSRAASTPSLSQLPEVNSSGNGRSSSNCDDSTTTWLKLRLPWSWASVGTFS